MENGKISKAIREEANTKAAWRVAAVKPEEVEGVDPEADATPLHVKQYIRHREAFGKEFSEATEERRTEIALADRTGDLRRKARELAEVRALLTPEGLEALVEADGKDLDTAAPTRLRNRLLRAGLQKKMLGKLGMIGVDPETGAPTLKLTGEILTSESETARGVSSYGKAAHSLFKAVERPLPSDADARPLAQVAAALAPLGISLRNVGKALVKDETGKTKKSETKKSKVQIRTYTVDEESFEDMMRLSQAEYERIMGGAARVGRASSDSLSRRFGTLLTELLTEGYSPG